MRSVRVLTVATAAAALLVGCSGAGSGTSTQAARSTGPAGLTSSAPPTTRPTGNGVATLPPAEIVRRARQAFSHATAVRIRANVRSGGEPLRLDVRVAGSRGGIGTVTMQGLTFQLLRIGKSAYLKATQAVWRKMAAGQPYPLRLQSFTPKTDSGTIDFLEFDRPVQLTVPPAAQVVDTTTGG